MTRRILAALVGLTAVLLAAVVVPLGAFAAHHDSQVFAERTEAAALSLASQAEERLADTTETGAKAPIAVRDRNDRLSVFDVHGTPLAGVTNDVSISARDRSAALLGQRSEHWTDDPDRFVVVLPVTSSGRVVGIAALARPAGPLRSEQTRLWLGLAAAGVAALVAAVLLALALARWVGRPLRRLETATARFGEGSLSARAAAHDGPAEIKQLATTFNQMAGRLESLLASQRNVLADVSHQLRTPLAALRLRLELMRQDAGGEADADLDGLLAEVNRLSQLVDGLLAVARAENATPAPEVIDIGAVTAGRVEAWTPVSEEAGVSMALHPTVLATPASALATPGHLEQVLDNLLANAIEATPAGGRITVAIARTTASVQVKVTDTGPGMSEAAREQALRRFWSEAPAGRDAPGDRQSAGRGSGLGLAIADRLLSVDQGSLTLGAGDEGGLVAIVELPAARERNPASASRHGD
jgi:signal transduction histidine kinase